MANDRGKDPAQALALANEWLKHFCLALQDVGLYSAAHPRAVLSNERAYASLKRVLGDRREVVLTRSEGRLLLDRILLDRHRGLSGGIIEDLAARDVESIAFGSVITPEEHLAMLRCLLVSPDRTHERGGLGALLAAEGVATVRVGSGGASRGQGQGDAVPVGEMALLDFLTTFEAGSPLGAVREGPSPAVSSVLARDPVGLARAILASARLREPGVALAPEALAATMAVALERLTERALGERLRRREEILGDIGRAVIGTEPEVRPALILEQAGPDSPHRNLAEAVELLSAAAVGELLASQYPRAHGDYLTLARILERTLAWRERRGTALATAERRLGALGVGPEEYRDLVDHLLWEEIDNRRRLELLFQDNYLWRGDFSRVRVALEELLRSRQWGEVASLVQRYLGGVLSPDPAARRNVAEGLPHLIALLEQTENRKELLGRVTGVLLTRLHDEKTEDVVPALVAALAAVQKARLSASELDAVLALLRRADDLRASLSAEARARGTKLGQALAGAVDEGILATLTDLVLAGKGSPGDPVLEILERTGGAYLIERLAQEQSRAKRARLLALLKEVGRRSPQPIVARLNDSRWYLVRNLVGILTDLKDPGLLSEIRKVASHNDSRVRREVVRAWAKFGTPECEEMTLAALADPDPTVRIAAVKALGAFRGRRSIEVLTGLAGRAAPQEDAASAVRLEAIAVLGRIGGGSEVLPVLSELVSRKGLLGPAEPMEVRVAAVKALGTLGTPGSAHLLEEVAERDPREAVRDAARAALRPRAASSPSAPSTGRVTS